MSDETDIEGTDDPGDVLAPDEEPLLFKATVATVADMHNVHTIPSGGSSTKVVDDTEAMAARILRAQFKRVGAGLLAACAKVLAEWWAYDRPDTIPDEKAFARRVKHNTPKDT